METLAIDEVFALTAEKWMEKIHETLISTARPPLSRAPVLDEFMWHFVPKHIFSSVYVFRKLSRASKPPRRPQSQVDEEKCYAILPTILSPFWF
jgi:hypothetical protein